MSNELNRHLPYADTDALAEERYWRYKNQDPLPNVAPALLNSADIADYVARTGMIFPFDPSRLGPASYEMVLGGEYLYWDEEGKECSGKEIEAGEKLVLQKNSITYVSVLQTFRIPDYIALRFNLRVRHVHRGLLLGTGPLIDPGFHGRLMIPIHNLTSNEYTILGGEDLISVEFTKVSQNPAWEIRNEDQIERMGKYVANSGKNSKKTFEELLRKELPIGVGRVVSSLSGTLTEANRQIKENSQLLSKYQTYSWVGGIALIIALLSLFITAVIATHGVIADANKYVSDAAMLVKKYEREDVDLRNFVVRDEVDKLKLRISQLSEEIALEKKNQPKQFMFHNEVNALKTEIERLQKEIDRLKREPRISSEGKK